MLPMRMTHCTVPHMYYWFSSTYMHIFNSINKSYILYVCTFISALFSLNVPGFEPRGINRHTKLARQPPYYNIMDPTPLGRYCCVGEILTRSSYVLIALLQVASLSRAHCSKRCIPSGLYQGCPFPNRNG